MRHELIKMAAMDMMRKEAIGIAQMERIRAAVYKEHSFLKGLNIQKYEPGISNVDFLAKRHYTNPGEEFSGRKGLNTHGIETETGSIKDVVRGQSKSQPLIKFTEDVQSRFGLKGLETKTIKKPVQEMIGKPDSEGMMEYLPKAINPGYLSQLKAKTNTIAAKVNSIAMSGRHTEKVPMQIGKNYDEVTGITSGQGIHPDVSFRGHTGGLQHTENVPYWSSGMPSVASSYQANKSQGYIDIINTAGAKSETGIGKFTPHIGRDPFYNAADHKWKLDTVKADSTQHIGNYEWGKSPVYERVMQGKEIDRHTVGRLKELPEPVNREKAYQTVGGSSGLAQADHGISVDSAGGITNNWKGMSRGDINLSAKNNPLFTRNQKPIPLYKFKGEKQYVPQS